MWSLPNIQALNDNAVKEYRASKNKTAKQTLRGQGCMYCEAKATIYYDYYDCFGDIPKGKIFLCDEHDNDFGYSAEGYFHCDGCNKVFIENYTWELYVVNTDDGSICINCAFDREIENMENWITSPEQINFDMVSRAKHIIPVGSTRHENILKEHGGVTLDNMSGAKVTGFGSTSTRDDGLQELRESAATAIKKHGSCILILDGAYQFAVSIGVYTRK